MKRNILLSISILPLILLSFLAHKSIDDILFYEKNFYFSLFVTIFIITQLIFIKNWSLNIIDILLFLFTAYILLNNLNSFNFSSGLANILYLFGFYFVLKQTLMQSSSRLRWLSLILIICFSLYTFHGFLQHYDFLSPSSSLNKVSGFYRNPAPYAALLIALITFPMAKLLFRSGAGKTVEYFIFILILIGVSTIIFSKSRAALMALLISTTTISILKNTWLRQIKNKFNISTKRLILISGLSFSIALCLLYLLRPDSAYGRLVIWKIALTEMYVVKPIFGHGIDAFQNHYMDYQVQYFENNISSTEEFFSASNTPYAFNEFVKVLIEEGIVGLLLFMGLIISLYYFGLQRLRTAVNICNNEVLSAALVSLTAMVIFSNFSYPFHDVTMLVLLYIMIAIISSLSPSLLNLRLVKASSLIITVLVSVTVLLSLREQFGRYNAFNIWGKYSFHHKNLEELESVKHFFKNQGLFYIDYAEILYENNQKEKAIQVLEMGKAYTSNPTLYMKLGRYYDEGLNNVEQAESAYKKTSLAIPHKFYPKYRLLKMYERNDLVDKSYRIATEIVKMPIKINSQAIQRMIDHANRIIEAKNE